MQDLTFPSYEHIIVADAPPSPVLAQIRTLVEENHDGRHRLRLATLRSRANNWGIAPAVAGISLAAGKYVCFLSDDNGYKPEHLEKLVAALDKDPTLGFVYSGCLYDGRMTLNSAPPSYGRIDLGQSLFRRELFVRHFGGALPFHELAWDWRMIQHFLQNRVRWKHIADPTFIFRLAKYPQFCPAARQKKFTGSASLIFWKFPLSLGSVSLYDSPSRVVCSLRFSGPGWSAPIINRRPAPCLPIHQK